MKYKTISEIHDAYDRGETTPTAVTQGYLDRIKKSSHNAYLTTLQDRALQQAAAAEEVIQANGGRVPREKMPLLGIPMGIKDALCMDGVRTTCGSKMLENYVPPYTSTAVARLESAGAISLGKLNMDEFAMGSSNENSAFGPVLHPTHPDRVPGGSSGGSATAVAADLCFASLGSDTGGSIRLPASFCGVVGYKPTYGRVSRFGLVAFASSLDQIGPITHSVEDAAIIAEVMGGFDPKDSTSNAEPIQGLALESKKQIEVKGLRIGIPKQYFIDGIQAEVREAIESTLAELTRRGAKLVPIDLPHTEYAVSTYYVVAVSEASSNLSRMDGIRYGVRPKEAMEADSPTEFYKRVRKNFGPEVKRRIILGTFALSSGYFDAYYTKACQVRRLIRKDFEKAFEQVDVIATPVSATTAFKAGDKAKDPLQMYLTDIFTIPASLAGLPGISIPCGEDASKLPIGLQILGPRMEDARVLRTAALIERIQGGQA
jgi:aspartyl-tRNA(Asn)/glutamyl-tRNA(Gln) amidotransferase subunit A